MKLETKAKNKAMENKISRQPNMILCCFVIFHGVLSLGLESFFLSKGCFIVVFAILDCDNNTYEIFGMYMIKPIIIAVIAAKKTEPAAMSFIKPILSL